MPAALSSTTASFPAISISDPNSDRRPRFAAGLSFARISRRGPRSVKKRSRQGRFCLTIRPKRGIFIPKDRFTEEVMVNLGNDWDGILKDEFTKDY